LRKTETWLPGGHDPRTVNASVNARAHGAAAWLLVPAYDPSFGRRRATSPVSGGCMGPDTLQRAGLLCVQGAWHGRRETLLHRRARGAPYGCRPPARRQVADTVVDHGR
jgi:hypothetical protein